MNTRTWGIGLAGLICSLTVQANTRDGFYLGAGIGASIDHYDLQASNLLNGYNLDMNTDQTNTLGNVFVGMGYTTEYSLFLGGELGTNFPSHSATLPGIAGISSTYPLYKNTLQTKEYATLDVLPGYAFNPNILIYGRAGIGYAELTLKQPIIGTRHGFNINENRWGGRVGVGANIALNNTFGIGLDYYYTQYQAMNIYSPVFNTQFKPEGNNNYFGLSVLYNI